MSEEEFIIKFYACDDEELFLKNVYHDISFLQQENQQLKADYGTNVQIERDLLLEKNKELKEKLKSTNKGLRKVLSKRLKWKRRYYKEKYVIKELKKWLKEELDDRRNPNKDMWLLGVHDAYKEILDKIKELEEKSYE